MGFLASDLVDICAARGMNVTTLLAALDVHATQIAHILRAAEEPTDIVTLSRETAQRLLLEHDWTIDERSRFQAAMAADKMLDLLYYYHYTPIEAMQKANAVYVGAKHDRRAIGGRVGSIYPPIATPGLAPSVLPKRRGRRPLTTSPPPSAPRNVPQDTTPGESGVVLPVRRKPGRPLGWRKYPQPEVEPP